MLEFLLSQVLESYLKRKETNYLKYIYYLITLLSLSLLLIANFIYFFVTKDIDILLICSTGGLGSAAIIYAICYYINTRSKLQFLKSILTNYGILKAKLTQIYNIINVLKGKRFISKTFLILSVCLTGVFVYKYSRKIIEAFRKT